jgi:hypothetical protein
MRTNKKEGNHEWMNRLEKTGLFDSIRLGKRLRPSILVWETMYQQLVDLKKKTRTCKSSYQMFRKSQAWNVGCKP